MLKHSMKAWRFAWIGYLPLFLVCLYGHAGLVPKPVYIYASQPGRATLDRDRDGGNPFASAVIELLGRGSMTFATFQTDLTTLTRQKSNGFQDPGVVDGDSLARWRLSPKPPSEKWVALVLVFSDYSVFSALPGAKRDLHRVANALHGAGFEVWAIRDPDQVALTRVMRSFADLSSRSDVSVLYATGHGGEVHGATYLLPGYSRSYLDRSVPLSTLASILRARRANLVFYGGCRNELEPDQK